MITVCVYCLSSVLIRIKKENMSRAEKLISFHVIERENNNKNFLTWTYPTIAEDTRRFILEKTFSPPDNAFKCLRKNSSWIYIKEISSKKKSAIVVISRDFEPKKYKQLCDILSETYLKCQNPVELVKLYLNIFTSGACSVQENGTQLACDFKNFKSSTNLKDFIKSFGLEIILLYTAILLKRRILLYNKDSDSLYNQLRDLICLVPLRNHQEYLYPLVNSAKELRGLSFYVAGTINKDLRHEDAIYDLYVNMETKEISISPQAEHIMAMTKTHKEIATFLVKLSESDLSEDKVQEEISKKTNDVLSLLKSLGSISAGNNIKLISTDDLKKKSYHPVLENFLFNLAIAENLMML